MNHVTFDAYVRRAATLLDRRSLFGGLSAALLAADFVPLAVEAKKHGKNNGKRCQKRGKRCRRALPKFCEGDQECVEALRPCCGHTAKCNSGEARDCCRKKGFCNSSATSLPE